MPKLQSNFIEITLRYGCSPANLLHILRTPFVRTPLGGCFCNLFFQDETHVCEDKGLELTKDVCICFVLSEYCTLDFY